jgi:hypothetical protein
MARKGRNRLSGRTSDCEREGKLCRVLEKGSEKVSRLGGVQVYLQNPTMHRTACINKELSKTKCCKVEKNLMPGLQSQARL